MSDIRVVLVEDQTLMRQGLKTIIDLEPGLSVAAEAADGIEGVRVVLQQRPDVTLMDVQMPGQDGVAATRAICARWPGAKVIILTTFDRDDLVFEAVRAGAMGFLLKDTPADDLIDTIRRVHGGEAFIQPAIATRALRELARSSAPAADPDALSERERDVLAQLAQGLSNRDIADRLSITEGTVKNHVSSILSKLQASNRTHAAEIARRRGLAG